MILWISEWENKRHFLSMYLELLDGIQEKNKINILIRFDWYALSPETVETNLSISLCHFWLDVFYWYSILKHWILQKKKVIREMKSVQKESTDLSKCTFLFLIDLWYCGCLLWANTNCKMISAISLSVE